MSKIYALTKDQRLKLRKIPVISSGDVNTDFISVKLDENWNLGNGITYYINFYKTTPESGVAVALTKEAQEYTCTVPTAMLSTAGQFYFALFAKNTQGNIIKTSTFCTIVVLKGAFPGATVLLDYQNLYTAMRTLIITKLNEKFNTELAATAETADIVSAINGIIDGSSVKADFIEILNDCFTTVNESMTLSDAPFTLLTTSMTDETLESTLAENLEIIERVCSYYDELKPIVSDTNILIDGMAIVSGDIDYRLKNDVTNIKLFVETLKTNYNSIRQSLVGDLDNDEITLDSADSDILTAISTAISNAETLATEKTALQTILTAFITAVNSKFSTALSDSSSASDVSTAIGALPTYEQGYALTQQFVDAVQDGNINIWNIVRPGGLAADKGFIEFPWIDTSNVEVVGSNSKIPLNTAVRKMGCDLTTSLLKGGNSFSNETGRSVKVLTFTGFDYSNKTMEQQNIYKVWFNGGYTSNTNIEEFYFDTLAIPQGDNSLSSMFQNCPKIKKLGGAANINGKCVYDDNLYGFIDFSRVTTASNMFSGCTLLESFKVKPNTLNCDLSVSSSSLLKKNTALSIINGFKQNSSHTLSLNNDTKTLAENIWYQPLC